MEVDHLAKVLHHLLNLRVLLAIQKLYYLLARLAHNLDNYVILELLFEGRDDYRQAVN